MDDRFDTLKTILLGDPLLLTAVVLIAVGTLVFYLVWFRAGCLTVEVEARVIANGLRASTEWQPDLVASANIQITSPGISAAWKETEERVIRLESERGKTYACFGLPRDIWNAQSLLGRQLNLPLAEAIPNLLVGIGLLFTFFFLTLAITSATQALQPSVAQGGDAMAALNDLLRATGSKFITSLVGLAASILWTIFTRRWMARLGHACEEVLKAMGHLVRADAGELATEVQVRLSHSQNSTAQTQLVLTKGALDESRGQRDVLAELLDETREQTGALKRFETDLAVSLATAINSALAPQFKEMNNRLISSIDGLSEKLGTMNQDALQQMTEDFSSMLQKMTQSELGQLKEALTELSGKLTSAGGVFIDGASNAGDTLGKAATAFSDRVEGIAGRLVEAAVALSDNSSSFGASVAQLSSTVDRATESGRNSAEFVDSAVTQVRTTLDRFHALSDTLRTSSNDLKELSGRMADAVDSIDELTTAQTEVVKAVRDATPSALAAVGGVVTTLNSAVEATEASMTRTKTAMAATATSLDNTVLALTTGVGEYSQTIADLHANMDESLAKAVGGFSQAVESLEEVAEELVELVGKIRVRGV